MSHPARGTISGLPVGLSTEIAARPMISVRTAETHSRNILMKLGFRSRAQVAAWVAEQRHTV